MLRPAQATCSAVKFAWLRIAGGSVCAKSRVNSSRTLHGLGALAARPEDIFDAPLYMGSI
jgi:hypothetical protein